MVHSFPQKQAGAFAQAPTAVQAHEERSFGKLQDNHLISDPVSPPASVWTTEVIQLRS